MEKNESAIQKPEIHAAGSEDVMTAQDYIDRQTALEKEAQEVLPGKFEKCTFEQGYIRQPLYACKTCTGPGDEPSGMCYSCSIACHSDHELLELFPKRNFRCDCGVPGKFGGSSCELTKGQQKAAAVNNQNTYNHNFKGLYCRCVFLYFDTYLHTITYALFIGVTSFTTQKTRKMKCIRSVGPHSSQAEIFTGINAVPCL